MKCYIGNIALNGDETRKLRKMDPNTLIVLQRGAGEVMSRSVGLIVPNTSQRLKEQRNILHATDRREVKRSGNI